MSAGSLGGEKTCQEDHNPFPSKPAGCICPPHLRGSHCLRMPSSALWPPSPLTPANDGANLHDSTLATRHRIPPLAPRSEAIVLPMSVGRIKDVSCYSPVFQEVLNHSMGPGRKPIGLAKIGGGPSLARAGCNPTPKQILRTASRGRREKQGNPGRLDPARFWRRQSPPAWAQRSLPAPVKPQRR